MTDLNELIHKAAKNPDALTSDDYERLQAGVSALTLLAEEFAVAIAAAVRAVAEAFATAWMELTDPVRDAIQAREAAQPSRRARRRRRKIARLVAHYERKAARVPSWKRGV